MKGGFAAEELFYRGLAQKTHSSGVDQLFEFAKGTAFQNGLANFIGEDKDFGDNRSTAVAGTVTGQAAMSGKKLGVKELVGLDATDFQFAARDFNRFAAMVADESDQPLRDDAVQC